MALFSYKDLCIDAVDPELLGRFWATALGLEFHLQDGGDAYLTGPTKQHTIWINGVPEAKSVKHRFHLDLNAQQVDHLVASGAVVNDATSFRWITMVDPEGGEFCVFVHDQPTGEPIRHHLHALVIDCASTHESSEIATWWAEGFAAPVVHDPRGFSSVLEIPGASFDSIDFIPVPEPKTVKNRLHIDVTTHDLADVLAHGATVLHPEQPPLSWTVCADPHGNEFCVFAQA
jgi:hypothetical protein